jgi:hypothetical protein
VCQHNVRVDLEVGLAAVADEDEAARGKVAQDALERAALALGYGLEDALQHAAVLLQVERARRQPSQREEAAEQRVQLPRRVRHVVQLHAERRQARVPLAHAGDRQLAQLAHKRVAEDLARAGADGRVLDRVVNVADEADARRLCHAHALRRRQPLRRQHAHVRRHKVERRAQPKVAGVVGGRRARLRHGVVVEEHGHGQLRERRAEEGQQARHEVRVRRYQFGRRQVRRLAPRQPLCRGRGLRWRVRFT